MKRALIIRHHPSETLGADYQAILEHHQFNLIPCNLFDDAPRFSIFNAPPAADVDLIMSFGGPMSANDDLPALRQEQEYLAAAIARGKPVFAVCLGAQLMALALGGSVAPSGGYQFGLRQIRITPEGDADPVFGQITAPLVPTLHGDCFTIPPNATPLAQCDLPQRNGRYRRINMAFRCQTSYAFQFEPQLTPDELAIWNQVFADDYPLMGPAFNPTEESARNLREFAKFAPQHRRQMAALLQAFLSQAALL